jgi:UDP-glucose 4-epimerase
MVAESWVNPEDWYLTNVVSNSILIKKLSNQKIKKYLNFSTPEVYGHTSYLKKKVTSLYQLLPMQFQELHKILI